jgi:septal ring factor EnvC (AmiA/AmiB activator)
MRGRAKFGSAATLLVALMPCPGAGQDDPERELARLQAEIVSLQRDVERQIGRRDDGARELREIELALAATEAEQRRIATAIAEQNERSLAIAAERRASAERLGVEQEALAGQVRLSYMTGRQELVRLLLSQDNPADFGRMLVYYDYLNRHRGERIEAVDAEIERLAALALESEAVAAELAALEAEQAARATALAGERAERRALVAELDRSIGSAGSRIERMRAEEAALNEIIERLAEIAEDFPVNSDAPFPAQRGQLRWPVDGRLAARFGGARDSEGRLRWDGVLIEAEAGAVDRAVFSGRVLLAEWTPHLGLLMIIDHGAGYMSLYGHNSALLRAEGQLVETGDPIAEVGDTGGQLGAGLYFGIRRNAEPVDPGAWVR